MVNRCVCVCMLAVGANAFFLPGVSTARSVTRTSSAGRLHMNAGHEADKAKQQAQKSWQDVKDGEGSSAGDKAQSAAHHAKEAAKDAVSGATSSANNKGTDIRASTTQRTEGAKATAGVTKDDNTRVWEAPVEKTRIHERVEEVDKTRIEEQRVRTEVQQVVQPIQDTQRRQEEVRSVDHGTEVREHGSAGLDSKTEAELKRRRDELAREGGTVRDKEVKQTNLRPDVEKKEFVNTVEQVVPVIEKDIYVPKKVEHEKKVVEIYNEAPEVKATEIKEAISKEEFEKRYGGKVDLKPAGTPQAYTTKETHQETAHTTAKAPTAAASTSTSSTTHSSSTEKHGEQQRPVGNTVGSASSTQQGAGPLGYGHTENLHADKEQPAGYSMSDVNMAHDAESAAHNEGEGEEGQGIVGSIKQKIKNILD